MKPNRISIWWRCWSSCQSVGRCWMRVALGGITARAPLGRDGLQDGVGGVGLVGDHRFGREAVEQGQGLRRVARLPGGQAEGQRVAEAVGETVQLAGEAAARAAERVRACAFSAPAAPAWARTTVRSSSTHSRSASAARCSSSACPDTLLLPAREPPVHAVPAADLMRHQPPRAARPRHPEHRLDEAAGRRLLTRHRSRDTPVRMA